MKITESRLKDIIKEIIIEELSQEEDDRIEELLRSGSEEQFFQAIEIIKIFEEVELSDYDLKNLTLDGYNFTASDGSPLINMGSAIFNNSTMSEANLSGCDLEASSLKNVVLKGANLSNANLVISTLTDSILDLANLTGADLSGASLKGASFKGANLTNANLEDVIVSDRTDFTGAITTGAKGFDMIRRKVII